MRVSTSLTLLAVLPGCYLGHGLDARDAADGSISPTDARVDASPRAVDAGPPLPIEPEDDPPVGPWDDVPPPPPGVPALVPSGEEIVYGSGLEIGGPPALVWNGAGWGLAWRGHFAVLDEDARLASDVVETVDRAGGIGLDFAIGRHALVLGVEREDFDRVRLATFDRRGVLASTWQDGLSGREIDVARMPSAHRWIVAASTTFGASTYAVSAYAADDEMRRAGEPVVIARESSGPVRVAATSNRAVVAWSTAEGVVAQVVVQAASSLEAIAPDGPPLDVLRVPPARSPFPLETQAFRDRIVIALMTGRELHFAMIDPSARALVAEPTSVPADGFADVRPGLAVVPEHGFVVACWATARGRSSELPPVGLQVIGADGAAWGEPAFVGRSEAGQVAGVDCGWNGREIVVAYWIGAVDRPHAIVGQRLRPTFL
jgi:hypothetical protein